MADNKEIQFVGSQTGTTQLVHIPLRIRFRGWIYEYFAKRDARFAEIAVDLKKRLGLSVEVRMEISRPEGLIRETDTPDSLELQTDETLTVTVIYDVPE